MSPKPSFIIHLLAELLVPIFIWAPFGISTPKLVCSNNHVCVLLPICDAVRFFTIMYSIHHAQGDPPWSSGRGLSIVEAFPILSRQTNVDKWQHCNLFCSMQWTMFHKYEASSTLGQRHSSILLFFLGKMMLLDTNINDNMTSVCPSDI